MSSQNSAFAEVLDSWMPYLKHSLDSPVENVATIEQIRNILCSGSLNNLNATQNVDAKILISPNILMPLQILNQSEKKNKFESKHIYICVYFFFLNL